DPHGMKPGTTMPDLFANDADKAWKLDALTQYLATTGGLKQERPDPKGVILGKDLYSKIGCVACHGPRDAAGLAEKNLAPHVVPLGDLKAKYSIPSLTAFLDNPLQSRPSGRMPHTVANAKDAKDIANYLLQGLKVNLPQGIGSTKFSYYEGSYQKLPDFEKLKSKSSGTGAAFDLSAAKRPNEFALRFEGYIKMQAAGEYTFTLSSDDGSRLFIDGKKVVDNDGIHMVRSVSGTATLRKEDPHLIVVEFMNGGGGAELNVEIEGRGLGRQPLFLFASVGCANCHQMTSDRKPLASTLAAPTLAKLKPDAGCLSAKPEKGAPAYGLSTKQKAALTAALKTPPVLSKEPAAVIARTMTTLNCYACHIRDKIGGPTEAMNKLFLTVQPEMGDEGRLPPPLEGVGAKLNVDYFKQILDKGVHDRPYMHTRMPGFGSANVGHLQPLFAGIDKVPTVAEVKLDFPVAKINASARHIVGEQALACIKCHTFNGVKAEGIQGIDMTVIPKRITRDWFHFYMLDPQKYRPGTRMPSAFLNNMSPLPMVLDGKPDTQIEAMWAYLKLGNKAALPLGMGKKSIPLLPRKDAIIYRNFIEGAGARAIGVGYPEKISLAFDANDMRLALLWQGAFIDAARHWEGRGVGYEGPLGDNPLSLHTGAPFAVLEKADTEWPKTAPREMGYKFIGYRLAPDERPTFDYSFNGVKIEDFPNPSVVGKDTTLKRTLTLSTTSTVDNLYYRAAVGTKIEAGTDGWFKIDGWKMKLESTGLPKIRTIGGKLELLVPVTFKDGKATIVQEFAW
ncbi:MAG: cytochrome c1, partial [Planctomycetes bacterium]|nr:cytochrome c1 [Planctomycetota bacterium]